MLVCLSVWRERGEFTLLMLCSLGGLMVPAVAVAAMMTTMTTMTNGQEEL